MPRIYTCLPVEQRFWSKVRKTRTCWLWTGARTGQGYGNFAFDAQRSSYQYIPAHRVAWFLTKGKWPTRFLCHECDVPNCVRPSHLFEGSQRDNIHDMIAKGKHGGGAQKAEAHHLTTLTWGKVRDIRRRCSIGESHRSIQNRYKISAGTVSNVKNNKVWKE